MSKAKFKVGDKVRILDGSNINNYVQGWACGMSDDVGKTATIDHVVPMGDGRIGYRLNEFCRTWDERGLEFADRKTIVIYCNGQEVIALDKSSGKKGVAKCSPADEFNFETGAKLAFERLLEKQHKFKVGDKIIGKAAANRYRLTNEGWKGVVVGITDRSIDVKQRDERGITLRVDPACFEIDDSPEYFTGKVVCTHAAQTWYTTGKIYGIKDGIGYDDDGDCMAYSPFESIDEMNARLSSSFIEVVE